MEEPPHDTETTPLHLRETGSLPLQQPTTYLFLGHDAQLPENAKSKSSHMHTRDGRKLKQT